MKTTNVFKVEHLKSGKISSKWVNQWIQKIIYKWWVNHLVFCFWWLSSNFPFRTNHEDPRPFVFVLLICSVARKLMSCFFFSPMHGFILFIYFHVFPTSIFQQLPLADENGSLLQKNDLHSLVHSLCGTVPLPKLPTETTSAISQAVARKSTKHLNKSVN